MLVYSEKNFKRYKASVFKAFFPHLIRWSRSKLIVALFGCGRSLKISRRASILAGSFELLNWLNVSNSCKNILVRDCLKKHCLKFSPFGNVDQ